MTQSPIPMDPNWSAASGNGESALNGTHTIPNLNSPIINVVHQPVIQSAENAEAVAETYEIPSAENWDFAHQGGDTILNVYDIQAKAKPSSLAVKIALPLLMVAIAGIFYFEFEVEKNPTLISLWNEGKKYFVVAPQKIVVPAAKLNAKQLAASKPYAPVKSKSKIEKFEKNVSTSDMVKPYALLPNFILSDGNPNKPQWSLKDEEDLKIKIKHEYQFQRYQAVEKVRRERWMGSQTILHEALTQKYLWTKANALIGLADNGIPPTDKEIKSVFQHVRMATLTNYLKRYENKKLSAGERYFMRLSLQFGHPSARLQALKNLLASPDELTELYVNAAHRDEAAKIVKWNEKSENIRHNKVYLKLVDEAMELNQVLKYQRSWRYASAVATDKKPKIEIQSPKVPPVVTFYELKDEEDAE